MTQDDLRDVIGLRMQLSREALDLAEEHRDEVWERLRSRISGLGEDVPNADADTEQPPPTTRLDGPERRRAPTEPRYADEEPRGRALRWPRLGLAHVAGAILIAAAVAAAITLS